ncbi:MAG: hypothetical protein MO853_05460 [Candidatus Protistobacter heckmanni]|nr:hypothetical protein [Candidatus Protistobacter heckmanni]
MAAAGADAHAHHHAAPAADAAPQTDPAAPSASSDHNMADHKAADHEAACCSFALADPALPVFQCLPAATPQAIPYRAAAMPAVFLAGMRRPPRPLPV